MNRNVQNSPDMYKNQQKCTKIQQKGAIIHKMNKNHQKCTKTINNMVFLVVISETGPHMNHVNILLPELRAQFRN